MALEKVSLFISGVIVLLFLVPLIGYMYNAMSYAGLNDPVLQASSTFLIIAFAIITVYAAFTSDTAKELLGEEG